MDNSDSDTGNKLVLIGDCGVGKTCIISRFTTGEFNKNVVSTDGAVYARKKIEYPHLGKTLDLDIWDTAGQEKYKSLTKFFYKDAAMIILVYDITNRASFENLKNVWYKEIKENGDKHVILGIAGNKCDLYENEQVNEKEAREFAKSINAIFALTSAQDNNGIDKLFEDIGNKFLDPKFQQNLQIEENEKETKRKITLTKKDFSAKKEKHKKKCC